MKRRYKILGGALAFGVAAVWALALYVSHDSVCRAPQPLPAGVQRMKAIVYRCYGGPEVLKLDEVAKPTLADSTVLIKVHAASVNPLDWHYMRGLPYIVRMVAGVGAPKDISMGVDFSGVVEAVGKNVKRFKPGDAVFGAQHGAFGEYVSMPEDDSLTLNPRGLTFEQAATVPVAGITALQALRDKGKVQRGQSVLINGASGGVGTFGVQIAKSFGADVTGVCSTRNVQMVHSIGAEHVIDYTREDFTRSPQRYDLIIDTVGNHSLSQLRQVLSPTGTVVIVGGPRDGKWIDPLPRLIEAKLYAMFVRQKFMFFVADVTQKDLNVLGALLQSGKVTPVIERRYRLSEVPAAMAYLEKGHARGKVVISLE